MSTNEISFNDLKILHVSKKSLKHSYLSIKKDGKVVLKTPLVSKSYIQELLTKKEIWIRSQLKKVEEYRQVCVNLEDELLLFGQIYSIDIDEAKELRDYLQRIRILNNINILKCYDKFYKFFAKEYLLARTSHYLKIMNLSCSEIKFRKMKRRWGSCTSKGVITFNTELMKIDRELIDLVVIHEISHLKYMNHSEKFHSFASRYIHDYSELNQRLKHLPLFL